MKNKSKQTEILTVTSTQIAAVTVLTLVSLAAGIVIAALFGNFLL